MTDLGINQNRLNIGTISSEERLNAIFQHLKTVSGVSQEIKDILTKYNTIGSLANASQNDLQRVFGWLYTNIRDFVDLGENEDGIIPDCINNTLLASLLKAKRRLLGAEKKSIDNILTTIPADKQVALQTRGKKIFKLLEIGILKLLKLLESGILKIFKLLEVGLLKIFKLLEVGLLKIFKLLEVGFLNILKLLEVGLLKILKLLEVCLQKL